MTIVCDCQIILMTGQTNVICSISCCQNFYFISQIWRRGWMLKILCIENLPAVMDTYIFTFPPVSYKSSSDFTCPMLPTFTSHDYRNPSHVLFPPDAVQPALQPLMPLNLSDGYPALDPALLAISIPPFKSSLTSKMLSASKSIPSNPNLVPSMTIPSTCPTSSVPGSCSDKILVGKTAGNKSTWATCNPGWPVMQPHQPLSTVEKEHHSTHATSRQVSAAQHKDCNALLNKAIQLLADEFEAKVQVIATTHNVTHEKVKKLVGGHKYYQNPHSTQLANAIIHDKVHEVNEGAGHVQGEKLTLQQIQDLARVDPKYQGMTQDEKDELLRALTEFHALKNTSIHATNSAAACDVQSMLEHIFKILDGLALHTGIYVCLFATRGHIYDSSQPFWYGTDNVMDFWEDVMDLELDEIVHKLEQWACMDGKNIKEHNSVEGMQWMCAHILNSGLRVVVKKKIQINFINFEVAIKVRYGINLLGWPEGIPFQSPCTITNTKHLWTLCNALKAGMCHWAYMSRQQLKQYQDQLKE
ncbi:hypothetical protein EDD17DRAFT_1606795 [Pisolithus thermaeus]|nr:hypothetical protein EDD17DRAFT_1606795 [Pisolithus thermaeus]